VPPYPGAHERAWCEKAERSAMAKRPSPRSEDDEFRLDDIDDFVFLLEESDVAADMFLDE